MRAKRSGPHLGLAILVGVGAATSCISYKSAFVDANYPKPSDVAPEQLFDPTVIEPLRVTSTLAPLLVSAYDDPNAVAACLHGFEAPAQLEHLRDFGACLAGSGPTGAPACVGGAASRWDGCMSAAFEYVNCTCGAPPSGCTAGPDGNVLSCSVDTAALPPACSAVGPADRFRLLTALGQTGEAMVSYEIMTVGPILGPSETSVLTRPMPAGYAAAFGDAIRVAANTLACDSTNGSATCATASTPVPRKTATDAPTLALSGGAANGAYPAGYLYQLLEARRYAITQDATAKNERFSAVVGNSVGSLLAPMVDLAFVDDPVPASALAWCQDQLVPRPGTPPADASACALALLRSYMQNVNEWDLLCVEDADFLSDFVQGPSEPNDPGKPAFGRFWPLERDIVKPFYDHFGAALLANGTTRTVMTADSQSKTMLGLDERVCRTATAPINLQTHQCSSGGAGSTLDCLPCGVLASIPNPLFARASHRVWNGIRPEGEAGTYLDGGLRSTFPVLRAVELSGIGTDLAKSTPVLALSTEHAQSSPSTAPRTGMELALVSLDSLTHVTQHWELSYATLFEQLRRDRAKVPSMAVAGAPICGLGTAAPTAPFGGIYASFMPAKIEGLELAASGYQFDPIVMHGLFLAGRQAFLDQARDDKRNVLQFLRWNRTKTAVETPGSGGKTWLDNQRAALTVERNAWLASFPKTQAAWAAHIAARRELLEDNLQECPE